MTLSLNEVITTKFKWLTKSSQKEIWISESNGGLISIGLNIKKTSYSLKFSSVHSDGGKEVFLCFYWTSDGYRLCHYLRGPQKPIHTVNPHGRIRDILNKKILMEEASYMM